MDLFLALSVHRFVTSVGSYAGFASIVGLAILILLFFAQARETNALRDHVDELLERIGSLESRLARQAQAQAAAQEETGRTAAASPQPARAALAAVGGTPAPEFALPPAPPAGVGAPALSAATRVIPLAIPAAAAGVAAARASGSGSGGVATAPPPATPAATNGSSRIAAPSTNGPASAPSRQAGAPNRSATPAPVRAASTAAGSARRPVTGSAVPPRDRVPPPATRRYSRGRIALVIGLLVAVAAAAVVVVVVSSSSKKTPVASHQTTRRASSATAPINPRSVTVAVLNGTGTAGLAHRIAQRLGTHGFQTAKPTTAPDQTRTSTTVAYIPGARNQALAVAQALKLGSASVGPVDQGTRVVGCGGTPTCTASVFVTVGSDLANQ